MSKPWNSIFPVPVFNEYSIVKSLYNSQTFYKTQKFCRNIFVEILSVTTIHFEPNRVAIHSTSVSMDCYEDQSIEFGTFKNKINTPPFSEMNTGVDQYLRNLIDYHLALWTVFMGLFTIYTDNERNTKKPVPIFSQICKGC